MNPHNFRGAADWWLRKWAAPLHKPVECSICCSHKGPLFKAPCAACLTICKACHAAICEELARRE